MDLLKNKTATDLHKSILAEIKKAQNELKCSIGDVKKASTRLNFSMTVLNELLEREV